MFIIPLVLGEQRMDLGALYLLAMSEATRFGRELVCNQLEDGFFPSWSTRARGYALQEVC